MTGWNEFRTKLVIGCVCVCVVEESFAPGLVSDAEFSASGAEQSHRRTSTELRLIKHPEKNPGNTARSTTAA